MKTWNAEDKLSIEKELLARGLRIYRGRGRSGQGAVGRPRGMRGGDYAAGRRGFDRGRGRQQKIVRKKARNACGAYQRTSVCLYRVRAERKNDRRNQYFTGDPSGHEKRALKLADSSRRSHHGRKYDARHSFPAAKHCSRGRALLFDRGGEYHRQGISGRSYGEICGGVSRLRLRAE